MSAKTPRVQQPLCDKHRIRLVEVSPGRFECPVCNIVSSTRRHRR